MYSGRHGSPKRIARDSYSLTAEAVPARWWDPHAAPELPRIPLPWVAP
jgi:hypothetical protein